jgi:hypothetical protein
MRRSRPRMGSREQVLQGVVVGVAIATVYVIAAVILSFIDREGVEDAIGASIFALVLVYYAAGTVGGLVWGLLYPFQRHLSIALLTGITVGFVAGFGFAALQEGPIFWRWDRRTLEAIAFMGILAGGIGGIAFWRSVR